MKNGGFKSIADQINELAEHNEILDIKYASLTGIDGVDYTSALVMYENSRTVKQKTFRYISDDLEVNDFVKNHDVIKIDHFGDNADEFTTVITYREKN